MSFLRPGAAAFLTRNRELLAAAGVAAAGLWLALRGGPFYGVLGGLAVLAGAGLAWIGLRRRRFAQAGAGPGVVEVLEGQVTYFGPRYGGAAALSDLTEVRLLERAGRRVWRLAQDGGPPLFIPVEAAGAEALFDLFAALPGLDAGALIAALARPGTPDRLLWRRGAGPALPSR
ncbi:MAG: hypothetical protein KJZ85_14130 [Rhodobacteraceae bacterium]|jgi:hypothetical protein|nr:hypothetical protein [Paracoccaceae bacterium]